MGNHIMLDLETLGTRPGCAILSIGAVAFDPYAGKLGAEFYEVVSTPSCEAKGLVKDQSTLNWWSGRSAEAQKVLQEAAESKQGLGAALIKFTGYLQQFGKRDLFVWGCGADFDQPIISACFDKCGLPTPWLFYNNRCYRTLRALANVKADPPRHGTYHHALDDAKTQAYQANNIIQRLQLKV